MVPNFGAGYLDIYWLAGPSNPSATPRSALPGI